VNANAPKTARPRAEEGLKSLTKVVRVLDVFSTVDRALSLADIGQRTGFPKSTAHRLLAAMREVGLLDQDRERDRYRLGMKLFELGNIVLANMDLHREARPFVDALTRQSGQAVHLAVFDGHRALVIHRADASPEKGQPTALIEHAPVHCTSVGKAILAFQPVAAIDRVIAAGLIAFTDATITDPALLRAQLTEIRARGYATDEGEHQPGLRCVGAPIRDQRGRVVAAISITGPFWRLPLSEVEGLAKMAIHYANAISLSLGHRPSEPTAQAATPR
jgi:DNA-binding IclR family transcriptional regulator